MLFFFNLAAFEQALSLKTASLSGAIMSQVFENAQLSQTAKIENFLLHESLSVAAAVISS